MKKLNLDTITACLEGLEETIILRLIDRAQFKRNKTAYLPGKSGFTGEKQDSLFDLRVKYQERMDALFGRFLVPEERPFSFELPSPKRKVTLPDKNLYIDDYNSVNLTAEIKRAYLKLIVKLCPPGDDGQYGSSVEHDVYALQAISRRIHFGAMYVAECKYRLNPGVFDQQIEKNSVDRLLTLLTRPEVESRILLRVVKKVNKLQKDVNSQVRNTINPEVVRDFFIKTVIPLTKRGEAIYLINRRKANQSGVDKKR
ncbi:MAG: chorismate mutase [Spirochaetota bacterium]